jgi:SAM-dependent methyltransferase
MFENAQSYERFMGRWSRFMAAEFIDFAVVPDEGQVLDIGSGTGALSFAIVQRKNNARVVGIDASREYVAYANSRNSAPHQIRFEVGDAQHLPFADANFGCTLSLLVFNFFRDPAEALREAYRVTESGGRIAAAVWDYGGEMHMLRTFWSAAESMDGRAGALNESHMPLCRQGELTRLWKKAGLENVQERPLNIEMRFDSFEDYWTPFLSGQGPAGAYAASLDSTALEHLRDELKRRLALSAEEVPFVLPARAWAVRGTVPVAFEKLLEPNFCDS